MSNKQKEAMWKMSTVVNTELSRVLVIGAGVSGCLVAYTLAERGIDVILVEKTHTIGGRVRSYGCKSVGTRLVTPYICQNCGVCLTAGLWSKVLEHNNICVLTDTVVNDITGDPGDFTVALTEARNLRQLTNIDSIVVSTGFESLSSGISAHLHIEGIQGIITGTELEKLMLSRTSSSLFENAPGRTDTPSHTDASNLAVATSLTAAPKSVAFIQCLGSRDQNEGGLYCSRVCCSYSTRAAKVIRSYYPECEITFFYMELQSVESGNYFAGLEELGIEFIKCRPSKIVGGTPVTVEYDSQTDGITSRTFDLVVLSDGIHAGTDNEQLAEICRLGQDKDGFLYAITSADHVSGSGIYVTGCARTPMKIDEAYTDATTTAGMIIANTQTTQERQPAARTAEMLPPNTQTT